VLPSRIAGCFEIGLWIDYARDLVSVDIARSMKSHLETGCGQCAQTAEFARRVVFAAREATLDTPPAGLVARAKAVFEPRGKRRSVGTLIAELVSPNGLEPAMAGLRAGEARDGQHILYQADRYMVDLRFETRNDSIRVFLMGQIADRQASERGFGQAPPSIVSLRSGTRIVAETASNEFGEFCMDYLPEENLRLFLELTNSDEQLEIRIEAQ